MEVIEEFKSISPEDLWVYNKLQLSTLLRYNCGPIGMPVPEAGEYIVRPAINFLGMGRNSRKIFLTPDDCTESYGFPSEFWCEYFEGEHLSVDFIHGESALVVLGKKGESISPLDRSKTIKNTTEEHSRWRIWKKVDRKVYCPPFLKKLSNKYPVINVEFIGNRIIEVHFRKNPDFVWGNSAAIPVYYDELIRTPPGYTFIEAPDYTRRGFYIN